MATISDFPVDTRIVSAANHNRKGVIIGNNLRPIPSASVNVHVAVEWDDGTLAKVNINDILSEASLEDEFKAFQESVDEKLAGAAKLIREASDMAESKGKSLHDFDEDGEDYMFDTRQIEGAMRDAGWNTSSWHC